MARDPSPEAWDRVRSYVRTHALQAEAPSPWTGSAAGSNVLVIQVEALNDWLLDADVGGTPVMPFLRELAAGSLRFTDVFDATHEGRSSDADYLIMASQHPLEHDAVSMVRPTLDPVALPDLLRERGYATLSAHAHIPGFWNSALRHERYGFQTSLFEADLGPGETLGFGLTDQRFLERTVPHLAGLSQPWMAWLITLTMHGPHPGVPDSFHTLPLGDLEDTPLGNFLLKARHTDDAIRALVDSLDTRGILNATTLVVVGDHTEQHRMDMTWVDRSAGVEGLPADVRHLLLDRVGMLVTLPGRAQRAQVATVGSLLDVAPTVLDLLGLPPSASFLGRSLLAPGPGMAAQVTGEVVEGDLMWTGSGCYAFPGGSPSPAGACQAMRAQAREQLEVSWVITRHGLSRRLVARGPTD